MRYLRERLIRSSRGSVATEVGGDALSLSQTRPEQPPAEGTVLNHFTPPTHPSEIVRRVIGSLSGPEKEGRSGAVKADGVHYIHEGAAWAGQNLGSVLFPFNNIFVRVLVNLN